MLSFGVPEFAFCHCVHPWPTGASKFMLNSIRVRAWFSVVLLSGGSFFRFIDHESP